VYRTAILTAMRPQKKGNPRVGALRVAEKPTSLEHEEGARRN